MLQYWFALCKKAGDLFFLYLNTVKTKIADIREMREVA